MKALHRPMDSLSLDDEAELRWSVVREDIQVFANLSGDHNPLHTDAAFARSRGFDDQVAHGYLLGSKVSALVGMLLPGRDCLILETALAFPRPIYPGDDIVVNGKVDQLSESQSIVRVKIKAFRMGEGRAEVVARGHVLCRNQS